MASLIIDGVTMPPVNKLTITSEKIWSKNTGRVSNGEMKGDLVAIKLKANVQFVPLNDSQAQILDNAISKAFFKAEFKNPRNNKTESHKMYAGSATYPVYSYADGFPRYVGVGVDLVEA